MEAIKEENVLLDIRNLKKYFKVGKKAILTAVDGVSFQIKKGETLGLVGESGCGKTTCGKTIIGLYPATSGQVLYNGKDVHALRGKEKKAFSKDVQIIFQDPYASLNPRMTVGEIIKEPMVIHNIYNTDAEREARVVELLKIVGLKPDHIRRYPSEFSGGQRQRIGIARALAVNPEFIVCDEPVSALDVSIQAQVINMFDELQEKLGLTYLFIAHDLLVVRHISDRIAVMYLGKLVEIADSDEIYDHPLHPYTKALISAVPVPDPETARNNKRIVLTGDIPSPLNAPSGCPFRTRCKYAKDVCAKSMPELKERKDGHMVACHLVDEINE